MSENAAYDALVAHDIKPSVQRLAVMEYLSAHHTHPTADEIYNALVGQIPTLSKTTVYNTLRLFVRQGAATMLTIDGHNACFDGVTAPQVDWAGLKSVNDDVVAWVQIPGTVVNFPVYQGETNDTYLRTNAEGNYSIGGQVFLDSENTAPGMVDAQSIIYGHHMLNGTMFKPISDMTNQEFFDGIDTIWYVTEDATYELEPLLVYKTDGSDVNARRFNFDSADGLRAYLTDLLGKAVTSRSDAEDVIARTSNVLTLCTCNYDYSDNGRTLLICVPKLAENE